MLFIAEKKPEPEPEPELGGINRRKEMLKKSNVIIITILIKGNGMP